MIACGKGFRPLLSDGVSILRFLRGGSLVSLGVVEAASKTCKASLWHSQVNYLRRTSRNSNKSLDSSITSSRNAIVDRLVPSLLVISDKIEL